ncbi:MAG: 3-oxoacyl-ACP reductase FabG [Gammaproteobacteria bacterium]
MNGLANEIALVTGASRGIGRAIALALGEAGATVLGTATTSEGAGRIGDYLQAAGIRGKGMELDVAEPAAVTAVTAAIAQKFGEITILVNNAGIARDNLLLRMQPEEWDAVLGTDLGALFHVCKACVRGMLKARHGRIVNISSVVGVTGNPGQVNYSAAKAGILGFTKSLAREIGSRGVTVNAVAPGFIETDMTRTLGAAQRAALLEQIPLRRLGTSEDVARAVVFLVSEGAAYITGETLHINGGMYMA